MVQPNRIKRRIKRFLSVLFSSTIVFTSAAGHCAGHFYNVNAAEGLVGALAGNFTLWDLATTVLGAAGFMMVNKDIQDTAKTHLGGNQYTLDYLLQNGYIEVNENPSYEWDWSGLKSLMSDWQNYADSRPLDRIRAAAVANGIDFDNLWIDTFKTFVEKGKIGAENIIESLDVGINDFCQWIGEAFGSNVATEMPIPYSTSIAGRPISSSVAYKSSTWDNMKYLHLSMDPFYCKPFFYGSTTSNGKFQISLTIATRGSSVQRVRRYMDGAWDTYDDVNPGFDWTWTFTFYYYGCSDIVYDSYADALAHAQDWINTPDEDVKIQSPDILTPSGAATMPASGTWAPNPYLGGVDWPDAYLQPVPAGAWSPAIDDLLENPALPAPGEAGEIWGNVFDPYMNPAIDVPEDVPVPTVAPRPTTAAGEGTMDVPYAVVPADPVPAMEDGAGQLPNIGEFFPFCIPGDFVYITKLLWSEDNVRTPPHIYLPLRIPSINFSYDIDIDFTPFDSAAELLRTLVLISFCIALAILTKNLIWS